MKYLALVLTLLLAFSSFAQDTRNCENLPEAQRKNCTGELGNPENPCLSTGDGSRVEGKGSSSQGEGAVDSTGAQIQEG